MFSFLCKRLLPKWRMLGDSANTPLGFLRTAMLSIKSFASSSTKSVKDELQQSFTVSYLINSCGLPLESAVSVSQKLHFETPERPDSVLTLLSDHGFTNTRITKLVRKHPGFLLANPVKTILPKLEFFHSMGVSSTDLAKMVSSYQHTLTISLEKQLMPLYNLLKSILLDDKRVIKVMKKWNFSRHAQKNLVLNISVFRECGMTESLVLLLVKSYSSVLVQKRDRFNKIVEEVIEMGYNTKKLEFVQTVAVFSMKTKSNRT